jgi:hypothetical protein
MNGQDQQYHVIQWRNHSQKDGIVEGRASQMLVAESRRQVGWPCFAEFLPSDNIWVLIDKWCVENAKKDGRKVELVTVAIRVDLWISLHDLRPPR